MAGSGAIFRVTSGGDTEASVASTEKIEFSTGAAAPDADGKMTSSSVHWVRDISVHPHPKKKLNRLQDGLLGTKEIIVVGYFTNPDTAGGITNFDVWEDDPMTNTAFPFGRIGIRIDDMPRFDLLPTATKGYLLHDVFVERIEGSPNEASFVARLFLNES